MHLSPHHRVTRQLEFRSRSNLSQVRGNGSFGLTCFAVLHLAFAALSLSLGVDASEHYSNISVVFTESVFSSAGTLESGQPGDTGEDAEGNRPLLWGISLDEAWSFGEQEETDSIVVGVAAPRRTRSFDGVRIDQNFFVPQGTSLLVAPKQGPPVLEA